MDSSKDTFDIDTDNDNSSINPSQVFINGTAFQTYTSGMYVNYPTACGVTTTMNVEPVLTTENKKEHVEDLVRRECVEDFMRLFEKGFLNKCFLGEINSYELFVDIYERLKKL